MSLKLRRGTNAQRLLITPDIGELIYTTDTKRLYAGDGTTLGGTLVSYEGSVQGALGGNLVLSGFDITGSTGNINISGTITSGNIQANGNIHATGNITADGNITLGNADTDSVAINADVNSNVIPNFTLQYDLGTTDKKWKTLFAERVEAELEGNIRAYDSTLVFNAATGQFAGQLNGVVVNAGQTAVQGNVTGNVTGDLRGNVKSGNGLVVVLDNGTDGSDAVFTGNVIGNLTGTVTNGVLVTDVYYNPNFVGSLDGAKITGALSGVTVEGDFYGNVIGVDSTILVDYDSGVLRGTHIGTLEGIVDTGDILISGSTVQGTVTNGDITFDTIGTGGVAFQAPAKGFVSDNSSDSFIVKASTDFQTFDGSGFKFERTRGTQTVKTNVQDQDDLGNITWTGLTDTGVYSPAVSIISRVEGTVGSGVAPGAMEILIADDAGVLTPRITVGPTGIVGFSPPVLVAGSASGEVDNSAPATYFRMTINGVDYAIPAYTIRP